MKYNITFYIYNDAKLSGFCITFTIFAQNNTNH